MCRQWDEPRQAHAPRAAVSCQAQIKSGIEVQTSGVAQLRGRIQDMRRFGAPSSSPIRGEEELEMDMVGAVE